MGSKILLYLLLLSSVNFVAGQTDTIYMKETEIVSRRFQSFRTVSLRQVQVMGEAELAESSHQGMHAALKSAVNLDVRQRGPGDVQSDISFRAGSFEQTLFLLNGFPVNNPQTGHLGADFPLLPQLAGKVEVVRGAATRIYGANAFSGAVNVVSPDHNARFYRSGFSAGSWGTVAAYTAAAFAAGKTAHFISLSTSSSEGYRINTDYRGRNLFYTLHVPLFLGHTEFLTGFSGREFGAQGFYSQKYPLQFESTQSEITALRWSRGGRVQKELSLFRKRAHDRFDLFRSSPPSWYAGANFHRSDAMGGSADFAFISFIGKTTAGIDYRFEEIFSNNLGNPLGDKLNASKKDFGYYNKSDNRSWVSARINHQYFSGRFDISGGVLLSYGDDVPFRADPGFDLSYKLNRPLQLLFSANKSFRLPSFTEMYYSGPQNQGNPDLLPEEAVTAELAVSWTAAVADFSAGIYYRNGKNLIDWHRDSDTAKWMTRNVRRAAAGGAEVSFRYFPDNHSLKHRVEFFTLSYAYNILKIDHTQALTFYLPDYLKHKFTLSSAVVFFSKNRLNFSVIGSGRNGSYTDAVSSKEVSYNPVLLADMTFSRKIRNAAIWLKVSNLSGKEYFEYGNIPLPGRGWSVGLDLNIQYTKDKSDKS
jgi:vitamin B12 transporter